MWRRQFVKTAILPSPNTVYNLHCIDVKIEELKYPIIIMIINRIMERDGRLEDLENKADKLHIDSQQFQVRLYPD